MLQRTLIFALTLLPTSLEAVEVAGSYCTPLEQIDPYFDYCWDNKYFVQAAELCLQKFDADVKAYQAKLSRSFGEHAAASASAQKLKLTNTSQDLSDTDAALNELLRRGKKARGEVVVYTETIIMPGNPTPAQLSRPGVREILSTSHCYGENKRELEKRIANFDQKLAELAKTKSAANSLQSTTESRLENLERLLPAATKGLDLPLAASSHAQGSVRPPSVPKGKSPRHESTITGDIKWDQLGTASKSSR